MINKYRVHEVAKDFDCPSKEILDIVTKHFEGQKKSMTALEEAELDVIFEIVTQENSVESFDAYFATANEPKKEEKKPAAKPEKKAEKKHETPDFPAEIAFDDFCKCKMQVARVLSCEKVEKSNKLLQFRLSFGKDGERTILSGIAKYYKPEELVGKQVVAVVNLAPRKIAGIESQGMILSAVDDEDNLRLMSVGEGVEDGAIIG